MSGQSAWASASAASTVRLTSGPITLVGAPHSALELQYLPGGGIVRNVVLLFVAVGVLTTGVFAQLQNSSKAQDESELRRIESESAKFERQNDSQMTDSLADDWVLL